MLAAPPPGLGQGEYRLEPGCAEREAGRGRHAATKMGVQVRISFPYTGIEPMEVPDGNLLGEYWPREAPEGPGAAELTARALANPVAGPPLRTLVQPGRSVLLLSDDFTRPTPVAEMLPPVLAELQAGGARREDIGILIASGTHRPMTSEELARKLGHEVVRQYPVWPTQWQDRAEMADLGRTSGGLPIIVNRRLPEAGLVVGLGHIVPHRVTGFSGGAKIVEPGVQGEPNGLPEMHWMAAQVPGRAILGVAQNPVRREVDEVGRRAGLSFVVDAVQGDNGRVAAVYAGEPTAAYLAGARLAREIYGVHLPQEADVVVIDSYPADVDFWQAGKAVYASELAVRPGGAVILVTPCPEGVSARHPAVVHYGVRSVAELQRMVAEGEIVDIIAAAIMALTAWVVRERAVGIMVSPGIPPDEQRRIGFAPAPNAQEALAMAFERLGRDARVAVLHHGGEILPLTPEMAGATPAREAQAARR